MQSWIKYVDDIRLQFHSTRDGQEWNQQQIWSHQKIKTNALISAEYFDFEIHSKFNFHNVVRVLMAMKI